jgi:ribosomal protein S18 acetylase RimI-like enzyme
LPALKSLIVETFGDGSWILLRCYEDKDFLGALLEVYLSIFLSSSTFGRVAEREGKVVGAVLASIKGEVEKFRMLQKDIAPNTLALLSAEEAERMDIVEHLSTSFQAIGQLLENRVDIYDGSLEFIAVSKQEQGSKIGKALWDEASAYYKSKNVKSIYLISDSACNVGFYDYNGFSKVDDTEVIYNYTTGQKKFNIFVYEYHF